MKILAETCHFYDPFCPQWYSIAAPLSLGFPKKNWCNARFLICNVHFPVSILSFRSRKHLWTIFCQYTFEEKKTFPRISWFFLKKENNQSHKFIKRKIGLWQYAGGAGYCGIYFFLQTLRRVLIKVIMVCDRSKDALEFIINNHF